MSFREERAGDGSKEVLTTFVPQADEVGWPTLFHHGLHFMVLYEASYWAALTLGGRLWVSYGPTVYDAERLPRVGIPHEATARLLEATPDRLRIRAVSRTSTGKPCGSLESTWKRASRAQVERAGISLPEYLLEELDP